MLILKVNSIVEIKKNLLWELTKIAKLLRFAVLCLKVLI